MGVACSVLCHGGDSGCFGFIKTPPPDPRKVTLKACELDVRKLISDKNCNPILVRFAWNDAGTYDQRIEAFPARGGANGAICFDPELTMGANSGLVKAKLYLEDIHLKHPMVSWADLIQMASAISIEMAGGPKINMRYGRVSVDDARSCAGPLSREGFASNAGLPDAVPPFNCGASDAATHLRNVFTKKMGFTDQEIVALSGARTIGRAFKEREGPSVTRFGYMDSGASKYTKRSCIARPNGAEGIGMPGGAAWTKNWLTFDNSYFTNYEEAMKDDHLLWLPCDEALRSDPFFQTHFRYVRSRPAGLLL